MSNSYKFTNVPLPYDYDALEPYIDTKTMHLHHDKHLQTYVNNLNKALDSHPELWNLSLVQLILQAANLPTAVQNSIINNGGGVFNHWFYFDGMTPADKSIPQGKIVTELVKQYGTMEAFQDEMRKQALSVFGSGYAWLVKDDKGKMSIVTTNNQDTPISWGLYPILCIDVWEHAYYLKHYNVRKDYIEDWLKIINWERANQLLDLIDRP